MNTSDNQVGNTADKENAALNEGEQAKETMVKAHAGNDSTEGNTGEVKTAAGSQGKQPTGNVADAPVNDNGNPVSPVPEKKGKAKRGAQAADKTKGGAVSEGTPTADQLLSPTLAKLNVVELGKLVKLIDLDSGQIRAQEYDSKRAEFFESKYRDEKSVPPPVAIQISFSSRKHRK